MPDNGEEFVNYIEKLKAKILNNDKLQKFESDFELAQLLTTLGQQEAAIPYFESSMISLRGLSNNYAWQGLYVAAGTLFASTLDYLGKLDEAEVIYKELIGFNSSGPYVGDYAIFLHRRRKDYHLAQTLYLLALKSYPSASSVHLKYAGFLRHVKKDNTTAETHYRLATQVNPQNADAVGSYASFLHGALGNMSEAEKLYRKAVQLDETHANNLCNFGLFLSEEKKDYQEAELMYRTALVTAPTHANTLYNYAVMLDTRMRRKEEAEALYNRCLSTDPNHPFALYNLAVLLEEMGRDNEEVLRLYERASQADPDDATTLADYGRFLSVKMSQHHQAEPILKRSIALNATCQVALYNLALLLFRYKKDLSTAESLFSRLLVENPTHAAGLQQLGRLYVELHVKDETESKGAAEGMFLDKAMETFERLLQTTPETGTGTALSEYVTIVNKYGTHQQKLNGIVVTEAAMKRKSFADDKDVKQILDGLRKGSAVNYPRVV